LRFTVAYGHLASQDGGRGSGDFIEIAAEGCAGGAQFTAIGNGKLRI